MIQKPKTSTVYANNVLASLKQTGIKQASPGGKARAFGDIVADQMGVLELKDFSNLAQTLLPYCVGDMLDFFGEIFGILRLSRQDAIVPEADNNFQFYVRYGTFGSINSGKDITVPAGTKIYTDSDTGPVYVTDSEVILPADKSTISFAASSVGTGSSGQAAAGVFTRHSFASYADASYGSLLVTNNAGITAGRDKEDDDSYRYRISLELQARDRSGEPAIRAAILSVAGIQDVSLERKSGLFYAYVYGVSPAVAPSLLADVQGAMDEVIAWPGRGIALAPDLVGISLSTTAKLAAGITSVDAPTVLSNAAAAAQDYIDNLDINQTLIINEIPNKMMQADSRVIDLGSPDKPLDEIYIWRSRSDGSRYSRFLIGNYTPMLGERIVTENIANAIKLTAV
jgi:hypothetical protein